MKLRSSLPSLVNAKTFGNHHSAVVINFFPFSARHFTSIKPAKSLLIFKGNKLTLLGRQPDASYQFITEKNLNDKSYNEIKAVSHIPLYVHVLLLHSTPTKKAFELTQLLEKINIAKKEITLPEADAKIQVQILDKTAQFIESLMASESLDEVETRKRVEAFFATIATEYHYNRALGAKIQLNKLHHTIMDLNIDYKNNHVVLVCPFEPRNKLIEKQYFEYLYKHLSISIEDNIFYIEKIPQDLPGVDVIKEVPALLYAETPKEVKTLTSPESSSKTLLSKINSGFLKTHVQKFKEMLTSIETVVIYYQGKLSLWKFNAVHKDFDCVSTKTFDTTQSFERIFSTFQKEYPIDMEKNRIIIAGEVNSDKEQPIKNQVLRFYELAAIKNAENRLVYYVESVPTDGNIKKHFIDKFLAGAELNQTYGEVVTKDRSLMFSDVLSDYATPILSTFFKKPTVEKSQAPTEPLFSVKNQS